MALSNFPILSYKGKNFLLFVLLRSGINTLKTQLKPGVLYVRNDFQGGGFLREASSKEGLIRSTCPWGV